MLKAPKKKKKKWQLKENTLAIDVNVIEPNKNNGSNNRTFKK